MRLKVIVLLLFVANFLTAHGDKSLVLKGDHGDPKYDKMLVATEEPPEAHAKDDAKSLREEIQKLKSSAVDVDSLREKSDELMSEVTMLKKNLLESSPSVALSRSLNELLKAVSPEKKLDVRSSPILNAAEAIADPSINVIDAHVSQVTKDTHKEDEFLPDPEEMKRIAKQKNGASSSFENLLREKLHITSIQEEAEFVIGSGVEQWKVLKLSFEETALIGRTFNGLQVAIGQNSTYQVIKTLIFEVPVDGLLLVETLRVYDSKLNRVRNLILVAVQGKLIWHELLNNDVQEIFRWNLLNEIHSMILFTHDRNDVLLLSTIDESRKVQIEFIEFNVPDGEFWVVQAFKLPALPISMTHLDLGKDLIVAFAQLNKVSIYRYQFTKHQRGKFTLFKTIEAANVSTLCGFRIGGQSYLAIGGNEPQILRYFNGDFFKQTILSQSFGKVEKFLPITIRTYRDDLILLVQHRLDIETHSIAVVDALVWNGIAFDNALSVPCQISADPNANGFTCMLDLEREEGLFGAAFIHDDKHHRLDIVVPRHEVHSGLFRLNYEMVDAEDPLLKDMQQMRKSIELINKMLDYEDSVKKDVEDSLAKIVNPKNDFRFQNLQWIEEIDTDFLELDGNVQLDSDVVEFIDSTWTQEDFLVNLDEIEKTIEADEQKLKAIDEELNKLNRINRQVEPQGPRNQPDSEIKNFGTFNYNGQLDLKTLRVLPQDERRPRRQTAPIEESRVKTLSVKNIDVKTINGISVDELVFLDDGQLLMPDGNITFSGSVEADNVNLPNSGKLNGVDFSHEVLAVETPNPARNLVLEDVFVQSLEVESVNGFPVTIESLKTIDGPAAVLPNVTSSNIVISRDLNIETINGVNWDEFVAKLVPKHLPSSIDELNLNGDVMIAGEGKLNTLALNGLPFPQNYVLNAGKEDTVITGKKTFTGEVVTSAIDTDGTIDGIAPINMITLDRPQNITSETTFKVLEVIKKLEVKGTIEGQHVDEFLPNPSLQKTRVVNAACSFKELIVEGTVTVETLNGDNLETILSDVVYETADGSEVVITGPKTFNDLTVVGDVIVGNNFVNEINLDNFLMTDRNQEVNFESIGGDIFFTNLKILGLFDGINATELERNSVRTFGDQFIETPLIISEGHQVGAISVNVKESLNGVTASDYLFINQPISLATVKDVIFTDLQVENLKINGDIAGPGVLENFNVADFLANYLSKTRVQKITVPTNIKSLITNGTFDSKKINEIDFNVFKKYMRGIKNFRSFILSGEQKFNKLIIDGNVNVKTINGKDFNQIVQNAIWLNRPNTIEGNLKFLDDVVVNGDLTVHNNLNQKSFKAWVENWISKKETPIKLRADKVFKKDVIVEEEIITENINNIKFSNLMTLDNVVELSTANIQGNVNAEKVFIDRDFNGISVKALLDLYSYDEATNTHNVYSDVHFNHQAVVYYLNTPVMNEVNVSRWMDNMIRANESKVFIKSEKIFINDFLAQEGIFSESVNDIKMNFLDKVVLTNDQGLVNIVGDLAFADEVYAQQISSKGDLFTRFISLCDTQEWLHYALPIDRDLVYNGALHIKSSALNTTNLSGNHLNGVPIESFFTLHTNQTIDHAIKVLGSVEIQEPLTVQGLVNGHNLQHERQNTVMINAQHQVVSVKTSFNEARVLGPLTTPGKVNSKNLQDIVLLDSSPTIESAVNFRSLEGSSLFTNSLISRTNFDKWYENLLWNRGKEEQIVSAQWNVAKLRLTGDATGNGLINEMPIYEVETNLRSSITNIDNAISNHTNRYQELCKILRNKADKSRNAIHILKHFELDFQIREQEEIFTIFTFQSSVENFIAVNINCTTQLYKWQKDAGKFQKLDQVVTGVVYDWATVETLQKDVFIITSSRMEANYPCAIGGLNVWKMNGDQMFHVNKVPTETEVLEVFTSPYHPGRFFTLNNLDAVEHYDVFGEKKEVWKLPVENYNYSFVPAEVTPDLTIYNGRKLFILESKFLKRHTRFLYGDSPKLQFKKFRGPHPGDSTGYNLRIPPQPAPFKFGKLSVPSIPAKSYKVDDSGQKNFVSKIREVGDAVRKSISETFSNVPKLTIKNANALIANKENQSNNDLIEKEANFDNNPPSEGIRDENQQVEPEIDNGAQTSLPESVSKLSVSQPEDSTSDEKAQELVTEGVKTIHDDLKSEQPEAGQVAKSEPSSSTEKISEPSSSTEKISEFGFGLANGTAFYNKTLSLADIKTIHQGLNNEEPEADQVAKDEPSDERIPQFSITFPENATLDENEQSLAIKLVKKIHQGLRGDQQEADRVAQEESSSDAIIPQVSIKLPEESVHDNKNQAPAIEHVTKIHQELEDSQTEAQPKSQAEETVDDEKKRTKAAGKKYHYKLGEKQPEFDLGIKSNETTQQDSLSFADKLRRIMTGIKEALNSTVGTIKQAEVKNQSEVDDRKIPVPEASEKSVLTPQIFFPENDMKEIKSASEEPNKTTRFPESNLKDEQQVPLEVLTGSGLREAENQFFPEPGAGELVMMYVGPKNQKRTVFAVTRTRESVIKGNHNIIEIYNDIFEGSIYQYIPCSDPSNLVTLQFSDETLFAFLESRSEIQVYTYRGIQGFVPFKRIKLPGYAVEMTTLTLPPKEDYKCDRHYLLVRMETDIIFYVMEISGNCGLSDINCGSKHVEP